MDGIQFGRWVADRRRDCGWASQRALALAARSHPRTSGLAVSEAFLSRLEAGLLVHPFRGAVRRRVVGLAWLLCSSPRQVRDYARHAELNSLSRAEAAEIDSLARSLGDSRPPQTVILPPPPTCIVGRDEPLATLIAALTQMQGGGAIITGMPGIGKTCLAVAAAHRLAATRREPAPFSDGIIFITCAGRHGAPGARTILEDVLVPQQPPDRAAAPQLSATRQGAGSDDAATADSSLARVADRARRALAGKRMLILLDGIEPDLPLDQLVDALQPHGFSLAPPPSPAPSDTLAAPVLLITSRSLPRGPSRLQHIHLRPLVPDDGVRLIEHVLGTTLGGDDHQAALRLCAATGGIPLALVAAATTLVQTGIPLALLAGAAERSPLAVLDGIGTADNTIARSFDALPAETRTQLAVLSVLQAESFGLDTAAALVPETPQSAVVMAGELVRHSLIEPELPGAGERHGARFRLPPLLRAYATEQAQSLPPMMIESAQRNLAAYADTYIERHKGDAQALAAEADVLRAALRYAMHEGEHERTVRLVDGLLPLALQRDTCGDIERLLLAGVRAGKAVANRCALLRFLNVVGIMRFYQGDNSGARRAWIRCLQLAGDPRTSVKWPGAAYLNLAQLADLDGDPDAAWHLAELGIHYSRKAGIATATAAALSMQAARARRLGERHIAHAYAREGLELVVASGTGIDQPPSYLQSCVIETRLELARIERDYPAASKYTDQYLALADSEYRLFLAENLIEHAEYALEADANQDAIRLSGHALSIANAAHATALSQHAQAVRQRAELPTRRWHGAAGA